MLEDFLESKYNAKTTNCVAQTTVVGRNLFFIILELLSNCFSIKGAGGRAYKPRFRLEEVAAGASVRHVCVKCDRSYMHLHHLVAHQRYECGQQPHFMCQMCHKRFYQKQVLYRHIRSIHLKHANFL